MATKPLNQPRKKVLIIGPSWVGDMVMAQSLFIDLVERNPGVLIDVLAPAWTAALTDRMPQVNRSIKVAFEHGKLSFVERWKLARQLGHQGYEQAIVLPNSIKSALVPAIAGIPVRTGFIGEQRWGLVNDIRKLNKTVLPMTVQRFLALAGTADEAVRDLASIPIPQLSVKRVSVAAALKANELNVDKKILVLCPGAEFGMSKQWPADHFALVADYFLNKDWQVWLLGSDKDKLVCDEINTICEHRLSVLAGKTSLPEAVDLMSLASQVVANDSGLMHIAAALQKPLVAVYGSTDPGHTPPLSANHKVARIELDCSPCFKRECPLKHHQCMRDLSANEVIKFCQELA